MIGECLVAPQTAGPPSQVSVGLFAPYQRGPVASLRTINVHWLLRRHRTVVAVLLPTGLKKSSSLFFPSTKNNRSSFHTPLTFYLSARGCSINQMEKRGECQSSLRTGDVRTEEVFWDLYKKWCAPGVPERSTLLLHTASPWHQRTAHRTCGGAPSDQLRPVLTLAPKQIGSAWFYLIKIITYLYFSETEKAS